MWGMVLVAVCLPLGQCPMHAIREGFDLHQSHVSVDYKRLAIMILSNLHSEVAEKVAIACMISQQFSVVKSGKIACVMAFFTHEIVCIRHVTGSC